MRLEAALQGNLETFMREEVEDAGIAMTAAVTEKTNWLKDSWRRQALGAGLSPRVANAIRGEVYPKGRKSMAAAGMVFARAGKGGTLGSVGALLKNLDEGVTIRARGGSALAVPTDAVPKGRGGKRMTPVEVEQEFGQDLEPVIRPGRPPLLVLQNLVAGRRAGSFRKATERRRATGRGITWVVMFVLLRGVTIRARLDLGKSARQAWEDLPAAILRHYPKRGSA